MKILDLDLPDRVKRCLIRSGIDTLEKLLELKCGDLLKVRNLGKKGFTQLMAFLEYNGLTMQDGITYLNGTFDYRKRLLEEMEGKPTLCPSFKEDAIVWGVNMVLRERIKHLAEKCAEQKEVLETFKKRMKLSVYPTGAVYTFEVSQRLNPQEFDVVEEWLKK